MFTNFIVVKQLRINVENKRFASGRNIGHLRNSAIHQGGNIYSRHHYCTLKACGVCCVDDKGISADFTGFSGLSLSCLLDLKCPNALVGTYRGIEKELKNEVGLS